MPNESTGASPHVQRNRGARGDNPDPWALFVARNATQDSGALSEFYDEASRYVYTIALRILRDPNEAEEITLDVFQQVWRLAGAYNPERCQVPTWLGLMARSRALDRWRSLQVRRRVLSEDLPRELPAPEVGPEHSIASSQESARVRSAIAALPEEQRQLILLAFWEGMSHSEVAGRTGLPLGTVKTRIRLGMLKLREALADARPN